MIQHIFTASALVLSMVLPSLSYAAVLQRRSTPPPSPSPSTRVIAENATRALVVVLNLDAAGEVRTFGSGFVFRSGVVATNFHVVDGASRILVRRSGGEESFRAKLLKESRRVDLAILQVDGLAATPLAIGQSSSIAVGDSIFAAGNPKGLEATFSDGLVSARRTLNGVELLQVTAPISPGSSGGPILDRQGRVIGIAVGKIEGGDLLNFAIPVSLLIALESNLGTTDGDPAAEGRNEGHRSGERSLDELFESFRLRALVADLWGGPEVVRRSITRVRLDGNWLIIETEDRSGAGEKEDPVVAETEFLLSDVVSVLVVEDGLSVTTQGAKIKLKVTVGQKAVRDLSNTVFIPTGNDPDEQADFAASLQAMVSAATANPEGDVRSASGPSVDATVEFIRSQLAMHGTSQGTWTNDAGVRIERVERVRSFEVTGGTLTVVVATESTYLSGRRAGDKYSTQFRASVRLADLSAAGTFHFEEAGLSGIAIGAIDGSPVTEETELPSGEVESRARPSVIFPIADTVPRARVIKALNYLIDLANARKEPDPF